MAESVNTNITAKQYDQLSSSFVLDLVALFSIMHEDLTKLTQKATRENWTPEQFINEIGKRI